MANVVPLKLTPAGALSMIRKLAEDTENIVVTHHAQARASQRLITRRQIELCVQRGTITEGPFFNHHGNWQVNLYRHAAGEEVTCVVAIDWGSKVLVVSTF